VQVPASPHESFLNRRAKQGGWQGNRKIRRRRARRSGVSPGKRSRFRLRWPRVSAGLNLRRARLPACALCRLNPPPDRGGEFQPARTRGRACQPDSPRCDSFRCRPRCGIPSKPAFLRRGTARRKRAPGGGTPARFFGGARRHPAAQTPCAPAARTRREHGPGGFVGIRPHEQDDRKTGKPIRLFAADRFPAAFFGFRPWQILHAIPKSNAHAKRRARMM